MVDILKNLSRLEKVAPNCDEYGIWTNIFVNGHYKGMVEFVSEGLCSNRVKIVPHLKHEISIASGKDKLNQFESNLMFY